MTTTRTGDGRVDAIRHAVEILQAQDAEVLLRALLQAEHEVQYNISVARKAEIERDDYRRRLLASARTAPPTADNEQGPDPESTQCATESMGGANAPVAHSSYPDPTPETLNSSRFRAVWELIGGWDIGVDGLYTGAQGNHVRAILDAIDANARQLEPPWT